MYTIGFICAKKTCLFIRSVVRSSSGYIKGGSRKKSRFIGVDVCISTKSCKKEIGVA